MPAPRREGGNIVTAGGRVLGVTALDATLAGRREERAYLAASKIQFDGAQFRHDIALKAVGQVVQCP